MTFNIPISKRSSPFVMVRKVSPAITRQVAALHSRGYWFDFLIGQDGKVYCVQDNQQYCREQISVELVDLAYDSSSRSYRYIHKVEADSGEKGILILKSIFFNSQAAVVLINGSG